MILGNAARCAPLKIPQIACEDDIRVLFFHDVLSTGPSLLHYLSVVMIFQVQDQGARVPAPGPDGPRGQEPHARRHCRHYRHHGRRLRRD